MNDAMFWLETPHTPPKLRMKGLGDPTKVLIPPKSIIREEFVRMGWQKDITEYFGTRDRTLKICDLVNFEEPGNHLRVDFI